ncbi:MAG: hypothetical protein RIR97_1336, partial [Pseudomonadota bacterium]
MSLFARVAGIVLLFLPLSLSAKAAEPIRHHMEYKIRFSGIPLANASFDTEIGAQTATISGRFLSVGLANFFTRAEGENTVRGTIKNQRFWPETYESAYR